MTKLFFVAIFIATFLSAEIIPLSQNEFLNTRTGNTRTITSDFILVSLAENGAGRYYYIDAEHMGNSVVWSFRVAAGRPNSHSTPSGIFKIYHKKRKWMSTKYPEPSGINNMNYSMFFNGGIALHQGNVRSLSHGCVHLRKTDAKRLFNTTSIGTPVIITRESYIPFLTDVDYMYVFNKS